MDEAILRMFASLPLQGPGVDSETARVLRSVVDALPPKPAIVDFGCGTGRSTLALARALPDARINGVDIVPIFVTVLRSEARRWGLSGRVRACAGDMRAAPIEAGSIDLIWSEGAAYSVGLEAALRAWRPLLRSGGHCVLSECAWLADRRPPPVAEFWSVSYPGMGTREENMIRAQRAGFDVLDTHILSDEGWDGYYGALASAIAATPAGGLPDWFIDGIRQEVEIRRQAEGSFGYVFYVLRPTKD